MEKLGSYELTGHLTSQNSGCSIWGFGKKSGKDYFVKQFLSPKFPENDTVSSPERIEKKRKQCERFEQKKTAIYKRLNENSDGNAVRVEEFFRVDSRYYISMRKIDALAWDVAAVAALTEKEKCHLCAVIAHAIAGLHQGHIVHADLKHDNILFMRTLSGSITAKIIDFDSGFLESDPPQEGEEIVGDQIYFSPEACMTFWGGTPDLTCKMDIFALGILFHQYFTGSLPDYNRDLGSCAGEAVAKGDQLMISTEIPTQIRALLIKMLDLDPHNRPPAMEVYHIFMSQSKEQPEENRREDTYTFISPQPSEAGSPFFRPGDL